ncbi:DUF2304 domain-containing protein [Pseudodesulfovibrio sp.]|nr:DUF2304 domain-containing protein [Pseudodesulfovibrio sp.]
MTPIPEVVHMTLRQSLTVSCLGLGLLAIVLYFVRARQLRERYCMLYVFIGVTVTCVPLLYTTARGLATFMGIMDMNSFFFLLAILGLCLICFQLSLALSTAYGQRKALAQRVAILEERLNRVETSTQSSDTMEHTLS